MTLLLWFTNLSTFTYST